MPGYGLFAEIYDSSAQSTFFRQKEEILILSERDTKKNVRLKAHEALNLTNGICSMIKSVIQEKIRWNSTLREDTEQREIYNNSDERYR